MPVRSAEVLRHGAATFDIRGTASPQLLSRLVGLIAQQDRIPDQVLAVRDGEALAVTIRLADLDDRRARILADKMRAVVAVARVALRFEER